MQCGIATNLRADLSANYELLHSDEKRHGFQIFWLNTLYRKLIKFARQVLKETSLLGMKVEALTLSRYRTLSISGAITGIHTAKVFQIIKCT